MISLDLSSQLVTSDHHLIAHKHSHSNYTTTRSTGELALHHPQFVCSSCTPVKLKYSSSTGSRVLHILVARTCINSCVIRREPTRTIQSQSMTPSCSKALHGEPRGAWSGHKHRQPQWMAVP
jgi:hypothetical protein